MAHRVKPTRPAVLGDVFYLILRRMRFPIILIFAVYSFCAAGLTLIPATDPNTGQLTEPMTLFEAFYVVSFTAATIGFGEVPDPFNAGQRLWMTMTIYISVAAWSYSLVNVMALLQDKGFQNAVRIARFSHLIYRLREPFYIVCGAGETGRLLCHGLDRLGLRFVVLEKNEDRITAMDLEEFGADNPMIAADASQSRLISQAGVHNPYCKGVVAITDDDATNQAIAVSVRLLAPRVPVLARIRDVETETHIGVFGGDIVVNPFERFAEYLAAAIASPERYRLRELLTGLPGEPIHHFHQPPRGHWIVCGYGRFGQAVSGALRNAGMQVTVIDSQPAEGVDVVGSDTKSDVLKRAGIADAAGLVTGHASDPLNLSVAVTARALHRNTYIVNRQNQIDNLPLFEAFDSDLVMSPSLIVAQEFIARITTPLLNRFLRLIPQHNEAECAEIYERLAKLDRGRNPEVWDITVSAASTPAIVAAIEKDHDVCVGHLIADPRARDRRMKVMVLMIRRGSTTIQLPGESVSIEVGDRILLAGNPQTKRRLGMSVHNENVMRYVLTGQESNGGYLWRWLTRHHPAPYVPLPKPVEQADYSYEEELADEMTLNDDTDDYDLSASPGDDEGDYDLSRSPSQSA